MTPAQLYTIVSDCLVTGKPFFAPRLGDGEAILLNGYNDQEKLHWLFRRQLGYVPEPKEIEEIQENLIDAYESADVIGVPQHKRAGLNEYWYKANDLLEKAIDKMPPTTTNDYHNEWLSDGTLDKLLTGPSLIYYVSCHDLSSRLFDKYGISVTSKVIIDGEKAFFPGQPSRHYPKQFNQVKEWIAAHNMRGRLFIYGAGIVGKIYGKWAKEQGAVALDLGNVFDCWAGYKTRGEGRGVGKTDETYKL
jgi:hypothetical protein